MSDYVDEDSDFDEKWYDNQQRPMNLNMGFNLRILHTLRLEAEEDIRQQTLVIQSTHPWQYAFWYRFEVCSIKLI